MPQNVMRTTALRQALRERRVEMQHDLENRIRDGAFR